MTSLKEQKKLLKDIGKGVTEGVKKIAEPFIKSAREVANAEEAVGLSEAKQLFKGLKAGVKKVTKKRK